MSAATEPTLTATPATILAKLPTARRAGGTQLPTFVFDSSDDLARHVAAIVAGVIRERNARGQQAVLGLPTGSTPVGVYRELVRMHREEGLDFSHVVTFVLNEFYGLPPEQLQSHHRWMQRAFAATTSTFPPSNVHIPDGTVAAAAGRGPLPRVRSRDRAGRRHRRAAAGHRRQRAHRLQRAVSAASAGARGCARSTR